MPDRVWTISNFLTLTRAILLVPISILLYNNSISRWYVLLLIIIAAFTDLLDGYFARRLNQVTELGQILDPITDKIAVTVIGIILTYQGRMPLWFLEMAILRDVLILCGGIYLKKKRDIILSSNQFGKWTVTMVAAYILIIIIDLPKLESIRILFLVASTIMLVLSFVFYLNRFMATKLEPEVKNHKSKIQ